MYHQLIISLHSEKSGRKRSINSVTHVMYELLRLHGNIAILIKFGGLDTKPYLTQTLRLTLLRQVQYKQIAI